MNYQAIYDKLPSSWEDVKLRTAIELLNVEMQLPKEDEFENIEAELENTYKTIAVLTGTSTDEVKAIPVMWFNKMATKTSFMNVQPEPNKEGSIKWKTVEEVTYDNFVTFTQLSEDFVSNMPTIIKSFSNTKMNKDEILNMNMVEIHTCFFLLNQQLKKSLQRMEMFLAKKLMKQATKEILQKLTPFKKKSNS